jgi:hypothetical protein
MKDGQKNAFSGSLPRCETLTGKEPKFLSCGGCRGRMRHGPIKWMPNPMFVRTHFYHQRKDAPFVHIADLAHGLRG